MLQIPAVILIVFEILAIFSRYIFRLRTFARPKVTKKDFLFHLILFSFPLEMIQFDGNSLCYGLHNNSDTGRA